MNMFFANTEALLDMIRSGWRKKYNRSIDPTTITGLDKEGIHVLQRKMPHHHKAGQPTEPHFRCIFLCKEENKAVPRTLIFDCTIASFFDNTNTTIVGDGTALDGKRATEDFDPKLANSNGIPFGGN